MPAAISLPCWSAFLADCLKPSQASHRLFTTFFLLWRAVTAWHAAWTQKLSAPSRGTSRWRRRKHLVARQAALKGAKNRRVRLTARALSLQLHAARLSPASIRHGEKSPALPPTPQLPRAALSYRLQTLPARYHAMPVSLAKALATTHPAASWLGISLPPGQPNCPSDANARFNGRRRFSFVTSFLLLP
jgi:hypothetical protein